MKKFQAISIIICLIVLILAVSFLNVPSARAAVPYPVPHRSWIKLGLVAYQPSMTPAQIDWTAKNIDWFDNPHQDFLPQYKAKTNAPMLYYDNYYCLYIGQAKYNAMVNYATVHGLNLENMFLHFDVQTTVTFGTETHTLPAGSRVPTYSWYSTGGDLTKSGARVVMNVANPDYRNFNAEYELSLVNTNYGGATYDGIWVDNSGGTGFAGPGTITTGGTYLEYPGRSRNDAHIQYSNDMVLTFAAVRNVFGPKGASGSKIQVPNNGNYSNWAQLFPYIDGVFREFEINPKAVTSDSIQGLVQKMSEASTAGVPNIPSTSNTGITPTDMPREKMTALAIYYLAATPNDYFCKQDKNASDPQTTAWYGALDYNVGQPKASYSILATGLDPSSPLKDSGTGAVTNVGSFYKMTDSTKNWPIDYWQSFANQRYSFLKDSKGNFFKTNDSDTNWVSSYIPSAPYPVSGSYEIATFIYKVFSREYDNAIMILKPKPSWASTELGDLSTTTHTLPTTADNPSGRYFKLNADGSVESTPLTQITLRNAEGVVLIKESALNRPSISKSVDKTSAGSGNVLTYTLTYANPTQISFTNARIEDLIPSGTTFLSASNGGTSDGTKVIWSLGTIAAAANGTVTFQVRVQ